MADKQQVSNLVESARKFLKENDFERALSLAKEALLIDPNHVTALFVLGATQRRAGHNVDAEKTMLRVVDSVPQLAAAHQELGLNYLGRGQLKKAKRALRMSLQQDASLPASWRFLGQVLASEGDEEGAAEAYRKELMCRGPDPAIKKALELFSTGRLGIAEGICREYLRNNPRDVNAIRLLAEIGVTLGVVDEAISLLERCLELAPDFHLARANYARALSKQDRFDEALEQAAHLEKAEPDNTSHQALTAALLSMAGRYDQAHIFFEKVLETVRDSAPLLTSYGHSLRYAGRGEKASEIYRDAIKADPSHGEAYWSLANLKTIKFTRSELEEMQQRLDSIEVDSSDKYHLAFAVGKALEDERDFDNSYSAYEMGNSIKRRHSGYKKEDLTERVSDSVDAFTKEFFDNMGEGGNPDGSPIFIVGLPRSGSTLIEQILASHSCVEATSELHFIGRIAAQLEGKRKRGEKSNYTSVIAELDKDRRYELGEQYLSSAAVYRTREGHFIDKLPNNFMHLALIKLILPNAKVIDARRGPMAACFANFKQLFAQGQFFTYSFEDIAHYYADYIELMRHWDKVIPGFSLTINYELVVENLEEQVALILKHCGLEFEEQCLRYHDSQRAVRTASSEQVRLPIFTDALDQWRNYESYLDPISKMLRKRGVQI